MLLENFKGAVFPGFTGSPRQRCNDVLNKALQAMTNQLLLEGPHIAIPIVLLDQRE